MDYVNQVILGGRDTVDVSAPPLLPGIPYHGVGEEGDEDGGQFALLLGGITPQLNTTLNSTSDSHQVDSSWNRSFLFLWLKIVGILALASVTVAGNLIVILTLICTSGHKKATNCLIISLAAVDCLIGFLFPVSMIAFLLEQWPFGVIGCKVFLMVSHFLLDASMLTTLLITLDRWWSIHSPFSYRVGQSRRKAMGLVACVWCLGFLLYAPTFLFWRNWSDQTFHQCLPPFKDSIPFSVTVGLLEFNVPTLVVILCNFAIYIKVRGRKDSHVRRSVSTFEYSTYSSTVSLESDSFEHKLCLGRRVQRRLSAIVVASYLNNFMEWGQRRHSGCVSAFNGHLPCSGALTNDIARSNSEPERYESTEAKRKTYASTGRRVSFDAAILTEDFHRLRVRRQSFGHNHAVGSSRRTSEVMVKEMLARQNRKAARSLVLLVSAFLVCWCPYVAVKMIGPLLTSTSVPLLLYRGSEWLCYFNSTLNPFLHIIGNANFSRRLTFFLGLRLRSSKVPLSQLERRNSRCVPSEPATRPQARIRRVTQTEYLPSAVIPEATESDV